MIVPWLRVIRIGGEAGAAGRGLVAVAHACSWGATEPSRRPGVGEGSEEGNGSEGITAETGEKDLKGY